MLRSRIVLAVATAFTVTPSAAFAGDHANPRTADCEGMTMAQPGTGLMLSEYRIASIAPYFEQLTQLKRTWKEQRGAVLRVEPQPGLTAQWLQFRLDRELKAARENPAASASPLAVPGARVTVSTAPDAFIVTIAATDRAGGDQVLQRANAVAAKPR
jgi:hypothetical protein